MRRYVAVNPDDRSLRVERDAIPSPGPDEVLVRVAAAGINRADLLQRAGHYPPPADASPILGLEVSGEIIAIGADVTDWAVGDEVCALTHGGGYADHAVAPAGQCLPVPAALDLVSAAALPEALLTAWHNLYQRAGLQAGEKVLIHGGASGVGTLAVQIAHALGSEVYSTAGNDDKCAAVQALGATHVVNYNSADFEQELDTLGLRGHIDVVLDMAGGDFIQKNMNVAAPEGRLVSIAFMRGFRAEVDFAPLLMKRLTLTGSTLRAQNFAQKAVMAREIREHVYPCIEAGKVRPVIDRVFPLEDAAQAQEYMRSGQHVGKILLRT